MSRIFVDGAEFGNMGLWNGVSDPAKVYQVHKSGLAALDPSLSPPVRGDWMIAVIGAGEYASLAVHKHVTATELWFKFRVQFSEMDRVDSAMLQVFGESGTQLCYVANDRNQLAIYKGVSSTAIEKGSTVLSTHTIYLVEIRIDLSSGGGATDGNYEVKLNGLTELSGTGVDLNPEAGAQNIHTIRLTANPNSGDEVTLYDDFAIDDAAHCGDGYVAGGVAIGNGMDTQWVNGFGEVDDVPPEDASYIHANAIGQREAIVVEGPNDIYPGTPSQRSRPWSPASGGSASGTRTSRPWSRTCR